MPPLMVRVGISDQPGDTRHCMYLSQGSQRAEDPEQDAVQPTIALQHNCFESNYCSATHSALQPTIAVKATVALQPTVLCNPQLL